MSWSEAVAAGRGSVRVSSVVSRGFACLASEVNMESGEINGHITKEKVRSMDRSRRNMFKFIVSLFLSLCAGVLPSSAAPDSQRSIELAENWKLTSAKDLQTGGAAISLPDYKDTGWYAIHRMPATVLATLEEDGVYPNLYFGKNLLESVPQELYKRIGGIAPPSPRRTGIRFIY